MPDPLLYLQAFTIAAAVSALVMGALLRGIPTSDRWKFTSAGAGAIAAAHVAGCWWLKLPIAWPPASALDRYLLILLPAVLVIEVVASLPRFPAWGADLSRGLLALCLGRVLLHRSVYLEEYTAWQGLLVVGVSGLLVYTLWWLLRRLEERTSGISVPMALAMTIQATGIAIMLGGYLRGGLAAMLAAATLLGASLVSARLAKGQPAQALVGFGVVSLCGLLFIGVFFGRLPTSSAVVLWGTPLLCWITECPGNRIRSPWAAIIVRLVLVAVVLSIVVWIAQRKFEREFRPLLFHVPEGCNASTSLAPNAS